MKKKSVIECILILICLLGATYCGVKQEYTNAILLLGSAISLNVLIFLNEKE